MCVSFHCDLFAPLLNSNLHLANVPYRWRSISVRSVCKHVCAVGPQREVPPPRLAVRSSSSLRALPVRVPGCRLPRDSKQLERLLAQSPIPLPLVGQPGAEVHSTRHSQRACLPPNFLLRGLSLFPFYSTCTDSVLPFLCPIVLPCQLFSN